LKALPNKLICCLLQVLGHELTIACHLCYAFISYFSAVKAALAKLNHGFSAA
jgi:hypothetical protein